MKTFLVIAFSVILFGLAIGGIIQTAQKVVTKKQSETRMILRSY